jgi:hypothetical protein
MARVAKTTVTVNVNANRQDFKSMSKEIKGFITLDELSFGTNTNGKEYLVIPGFGVTYMRIKEIKTGVKYGVVQFESTTEGNEGALALNKISGADELAHYVAKFPGQSMLEIKELFGIKL